DHGLPIFIFLTSTSAATFGTGGGPPIFAALAKYRAPANRRACAEPGTTMATVPGPKGGIIEVNDLRTVLRIVSKNWYFVVIALLLSAVLSYLYSYKIPDVYGA